MEEIAILEEGYFISHSEITKKCFSKVETREGMKSYEYKIQVFDICTPYLTDLQALNLAQGQTSKKDRKLAKSKKRKLEVQHPCYETSLKLRSEVMQANLFTQPPSISEIESNNRQARDFVAKFLQRNYDSERTLQGENPSTTSRIIQMDEAQFVIPTECAYHQKDVSKLSELENKFDILIIDPPWQNRFIKRKILPGDKRKGYKMMENALLMEIPMLRFIKPDSLVVIWCTNSSTHLNFLKNDLLPHWKLKYVATWFWVKVTRSGEFVTPFTNSTGKQPYEQLILARSEKFDRSLPNPKEEKIIMSVPSAIHSFKPPLKDLLEPYVKDVNCGLEVFARSLTPGWVSWGNQVLLLQNVDLFTES